jgi:hypothetical protein
MSVVRTISVPEGAVANPASDALTASGVRYCVTPSQEITVDRLLFLPPSRIARLQHLGHWLDGQITRKLPPIVGDRQPSCPDPLKFVGRAVGLVDLHHLKVETALTPGNTVQTRAHGHVPGWPSRSDATQTPVNGLVVG